MAVYYLDASALVKLYVQEPGTDRLLRLASDSVENRMVVLALSAIEVRSAIRRRQRAGDIAPDAASLILDVLQSHLESRFLQQPLNDTVLDGAREMIDRYALRAYDAIQLAGCLAFKMTAGNEGPTFVCADQQLLAAAHSELMTVLDPCAGS